MLSVDFAEIDSVGLGSGSVEPEMSVAGVVSSCHHKNLTDRKNRKIHKTQNHNTINNKMFI